MPDIKPVRWIASSKSDLSSMPADVRRRIGLALSFAQSGKKNSDAKVLKGFGSADVVEVIARHDGDAFRLVYTVKFQEAVYVLHAFQKKSTSGIATPQHELELVRSRLKLAQADYLGWMKSKGKT